MYATDMDRLSGCHCVSHVSLTKTVHIIDTHRPTPTVLLFQLFHGFIYSCDRWSHDLCYGSCYEISVDFPGKGRTQFAKPLFVDKGFLYIHKGLVFFSDKGILQIRASPSRMYIDLMLMCFSVRNWRYCVVRQRKRHQRLASDLVVCTRCASQRFYSVYFSNTC